MSMATAPTPGDDGVAPRALLEDIPINVTGKRKRSGGPRTARGKEISSKDSTRHGILSTSPVIGLKSEEDWEAHLEGMRGHCCIERGLAWNRWGSCLGRE
jgi:hypothetical protein